VQLLTSSVLQQLQEAACNADDVEKQETCLGLNLVVQFLFQELKDTQKVRRYVLHCWVLREKTVRTLYYLQLFILTLP